MKREVKPIRALILTCLVFMVITSCGGTTDTSLPTHAPTSPSVPTLTPWAGSPVTLPTLSLSPEAVPTLAELKKITPENVAQVELLAEVGEGTFNNVIRVSPDGNMLAVATAGGIILVDAGSGQRLGFYPAPTAVDSWLAPVRALVQPVSEGLFAGGLEIKKISSASDRLKFRLSVLFGVWKEGDHRDWNAIREWTTSVYPLLKK